MEIRKIVGATKGEIETKKFNIFIPISLGNKWFTEKNIEKYLIWALEKSKDKVLVVIADKLHQINVEVKDHYSFEKAKRKVERISVKLEKEIKEIVNNFNSQDKERIKILRWEDIDKERKYLFIKNEIYLEFNTNKDFRETILEIVRESIAKIENRNFSENEIVKLSEYVLNELPVFLYGVEHEGKLYNLHPYPVFTKICKLVNEIQRGKFIDFYNRIDKPHAGIVELITLQ